MGRWGDGEKKTALEPLLTLLPTYRLGQSGTSWIERHLPGLSTYRASWPERHLSGQTACPPLTLNPLLVPQLEIYVPTFSPRNSRAKFSGSKMSNTTSGMFLSAHSVSAVASIT